MHLLVIGAGPGISSATARRFGRAGYDVGLVARREEALVELHDDLRADGVGSGWAPADAGDPASLTAAVRSLVDTFGPADVLLYNVSVGRQAAVPDLSPEDLLADLAAGVVGLQAAVRAVLPGMREQGSGHRPRHRQRIRRPAHPLDGDRWECRRRRCGLSWRRRPPALRREGIHVATVTIRGLVGEGDRQIPPSRIADLYAELVAETAGPRERWRTLVDVTP